MPGDEVHHEAGSPADAPPDSASARSGPRHAAPRKPLLTRLHVPAGKAVALAAMPSAVLMGMGLMPQLANAKPMPKSPFKPGPCVSQPDKEDEDHKSEKEKKQEKEAKEKIEAARKKAEEAKKEAHKGSGSDSGGKGSGSSDSGSSDGSGKGDSSSDKGSGSDSGGKDSGSSDSGSGGSGKGSGKDGDGDGKKKNPLDPLGVGDALGKVFDPDKKDDSGDGTSSGSDDSKGSTDSEDAAKKHDDSEDAAKKHKDAGDTSGKGGSGSGSASGDGAVGKVGDGVKDTTHKLGKGASDAAKGVKDDTDALGKSAGSKGDSGDKADKGGADADGKKPFPCVKEKKVDGKGERTPATIPNDPWHLEASSLGLHGLDYKGVVNIRTADGKTKQALKFTADSLDIGDLHQIVDASGSTKYHVQAAKGSNSTIRGGKVTMYTERLEGNLFGLIPIVFDPEHPPPINIPEAYFTKVKVTQAGQFGGTLTIPGLHQYVD